MTMCLALSVAIPSTVQADHGGSAARDAAVDIQAARDRADAAAQAFFDKESEIDQLKIAIAAAEVELAQVESEAEEMRQGLEYQAVRQFVGSGPTSFPLLIDLDDANNSLTAGVYTSVASETAIVDLDDFDAVMTEIDEQRDSLESQRNDAEEATQTYAALQKAAEDEVVILGEIEALRLRDEAVQHELEEQQRERDRRERVAAAEAAAATQVAPAPVPVATPAAPDQPAATAPRPLPESEAPASDQSPPATTDPPASPAPEPIAPAPPTPTPDTGSSLACPIAGPRSFADTWGAPRSGGRSHEGVDMMSPGGTPLVAMEAGEVKFKTNNLGGNTVRLYGASGTSYYYAHLSSWEGSSRPVAKGDVIGYVGKTGNTSANHLHLQVHPGGGQAVNPYPYARRACG